MQTMKATVFHSANHIGVEEAPRPTAGPGEAVIRITLTTICGTDLHILRGEYPVKPGLIIGHEPVGVITELGPGVTGYEIGDRVLVGAIALRAVQCLPERASVAMRARQRLRSHWRLAFRQHHQRSASRVSAGSQRTGEPG